MSVKRTPRPQMTRRQRASTPESQVQIMPFFIENIKRNEDLFQLTTDTRLKVTDINIHIREMTGGPYRLQLILEAHDGTLTVERSIKEGFNKISFPHNIEKGETLRFDFLQVDMVYKNVKGVSGSLVLRA